MFLSVLEYYTVLFFVVSWILTSYEMMTTNKLLSIECGIENFFITRYPFSLQFFLIGLVFILFDLELIVLILMMKHMNSFFFSFWIYFILFFSLFMFFTLLIEWKMNKLIWF